MAYEGAIPDPTEEQLRDWHSYPVKVHPLVWHHRSGRKSIALSKSAAEIEGMAKKDSDALLERIWAWVTKREYVYQHHWQMGDLLIWDNTGVMHRVLPYPKDSGRHLRRTALMGEESVA